MQGSGDGRGFCRWSQTVLDWISLLWAIQLSYWKLNRVNATLFYWTDLEILFWCFFSFIFNSFTYFKTPIFMICAHVFMPLRDPMLIYYPYDDWNNVLFYLDQILNTVLDERVISSYLETICLFVCVTAIATERFKRFQQNFVKMSFGTKPQSNSLIGQAV